MKKIFLILLVSAFLVSCGQNNAKISENTTQTGIIENKTQTGIIETQTGMTETHKMAETNSPKTEKIVKHTKEEIERSKDVIGRFYEDYPDLMKNFDKETVFSVTYYYPNVVDYFLKDKNWVYFVNIIGKTIKKLEWADTKTFEKDTKSYAYKDKNSVYSPETGEKYDIDRQTFKGLWPNIMKDANNVFVDEKKVPEINAKNFEQILEYGLFYKNDTSVYYFDSFKKLVPLDVDMKSFKPLGDYAFKDKNSVYFYLNHTVQKQSQFDLETFEALNVYYFKDKNGIYALDWGVTKVTKIEDADAATFKIVEDGYSIEPSIIDSMKAKDKNNVYEYGVKVKE